MVRKIPAGSELTKFLSWSNLWRNGFQKIGLGDQPSSYQNEVLNIGFYYRKVFEISHILFSYLVSNTNINSQGRFAGLSLYVKKDGDIQGSTLYYKDGPQLPPLNFTTTCTKYGGHFIYYNERLNEVSYPKDYEVANVVTELCEVFVEGKLIEVEI